MNIPCKDCITLAICICEYFKEEEEINTNPIHPLADKCILLKNYLKDDNCTIDGGWFKMRNVHHFYNTIDRML